MCKRMVLWGLLASLVMLAGCSMPKEGRLLVDRKELAPVEHLVVVLVLPQPGSAVPARLLKQQGFADGRFAQAFRARMQADFRANGVKTDVYTITADQAGNARISLVAAPYSHQLMMFPRRLDATHGRLRLAAVAVTLFDLKSHKVAWQSTEEIPVDPQGKGADAVSRHILNSWADVGLIPMRPIQLPKRLPADGDRD